LRKILCKISISFRQPGTFSRMRYALQILCSSTRSVLLFGVRSSAVRCDVQFCADINCTANSIRLFTSAQPSGPCKGELLLQEIQSERSHIFSWRPGRVDFPPRRQGIPFVFLLSQPAPPRACYIAISALRPLTSCPLTMLCGLSVCPTRVITRKN